MPFFNQFKINWKLHHVERILISLESMAFEYESRIVIFTDMIVKNGCYYGWHLDYRTDGGI